MANINSKLHAFGSWWAIAVLYAWPMLSLVAIVGIMSDTGWIGQEIVLAASLGSFGLFVAGCFALVCTTSRKTETAPSMRPVVILYQVILILTLAAYTALVWVVSG